MIGDIRKHLENQPFVPFVINMADGRNIRVATRDHIALASSLAIVTQDTEDYDVLPGLLMNGLKVDASTDAVEKP
jgi:hypothetical protein